MTLNTLSRRQLLRHSQAVATAAAARAALPAWLPRLTFAPLYQNLAGDVLVVVFLRGGADTLNMIVPHGEDAYYSARPQLAIPRPDDSADLRAVDLDGFFGLHPSLARLLPVFQNGGMTAVHATGSPDPTRSHFEAMDFMERGTPGEHGLNTGWVGRHLASLENGNRSPLRAVGWGTAPQAAIQGPISPVAIQSIVDYHLQGDRETAAAMLASLNRLYAVETEESLQAAAEATSDAINLVQRIDINGYVPQNGATYPENEFAAALKQTAALVRAQVGLETAAIDLGGWDTHVNQGSTEGQQANLLTTLSEGLAAFHQDMGADMRRVTVVVMSEFGRRLQENGARGTDHGHGGALLVMNGDLQAAPVVAKWPGLAPDTLDDGDLAITTDYRDVLSEIIRVRLGNDNLNAVFPDFAPGGVGLWNT